MAVPILAAVAATATFAAAPAVFGAIGATALLGTAVGGLNVLGAGVAALAAGAVSYGISAIGASAFPQKRGAVTRAPVEPLIRQATDRVFQIRSTVAPHRIIYGRARLGGVLVFAHTNAAPRTSFASAVNGFVAANYAKEDLLYLVHVLSGHRIDGIDSVQVDGIGIGDERYRGLIYVSYGYGTEDQAGDAMLAGETDGQWGANHRLRGRAYISSVLKWDSTVWRAGIPNISVVARGRLVYDPRTGAEAFSTNAALAVADYITSPFGLRAGWDEIDLPALIAAANICDERVALASGGTEARYECNGTFDLDEAPGRVLERLLSAMAGAAYFAGGKWYIHAGAWSEPTFTLTQDMLRGEVTVRANRPARDLWNGVRGVYIRPDSGWQPTDAPPLQDAAALAADGGVESYGDLALDFTTSGTCAQRLMQIALRRNRLQRQVSFPANLSALAIRANDVVTLSLPRLGTDTYRVSSWSLSPDGGVDLVLEQDSPAAYAWDAAADEQALPDPAPAVTLPSGATLPAPTVTITTYTAAVPTTISGTFTSVTGATAYEVQWRLPNAANWTSVSPSGTSFTATTNSRAAWRVRATAGSVVSEWAEVLLPDGPDFQATGTVGGYSVTVFLAAGVTKAHIFVHTADDVTAATKLGTEPTDSTPVNVTDASGIGKYVWVRSINTAGNPGGFTGPVYVVPTVDGGGGSGEFGGGGGDGGDGGAGGSGGDGGGGGDGGE